MGHCGRGTVGVALWAWHSRWLHGKDGSGLGLTFLIAPVKRYRMIS